MATPAYPGDLHACQRRSIEAAGPMDFRAGSFAGGMPSTGATRVFILQPRVGLR